MVEGKPEEGGVRSLVRSAAKPLHLGLGILAAVMIWDPAARGLGILGLVAFLVLVAYDAYAREGAPPARAQTNTASSGVEVASYADLVKKASAARRRIHDAVDSSGRSLARVMAPIKSSADQIVARLEGLVERAERISRFLARQNPEEIRASLRALEEQAASTADSFAREQYLQARQAREEQLRGYEELSLCLARVNAQVANVITTLEAAEGKVIRLQAADLQQAGEVTDAVTQGLQELSQEIKGFQESVDATIALRAG